jgi:hypothetical protein
MSENTPLNPPSPDTVEEFQKEHKDAPFFKKHPKGFGEMVLLEDVKIEKTYVLPVPNLCDTLPHLHRQASNKRKIDTQVCMTKYELLKVFLLKLGRAL